MKTHMQNTTAAAVANHVASTLGLDLDGTRPIFAEDWRPRDNYRRKSLRAKPVLVAVETRRTAGRFEILEVRSVKH